MCSIARVEGMAHGTLTLDVAMPNSAGWSGPIGHASMVPPPIRYHLAFSRLPLLDAVLYVVVGVETTWIPTQCDDLSFQTVWNGWVDVCGNAYDGDIGIH